MARLEAFGRLVLVGVSAAILSIAAFFLISQHFSTDTGRTRDLEMRVQALESSQNTLSEFIGRLHILSPGRPIQSDRLDLRLSAEQNATNRFQLRGHFKIPTDARPVAAWVSQWTPRADIAKFDEFYLVPHPDTGEVELITKPRPGETIDMLFEIHMLMKDLVKIQQR